MESCCLGFYFVVYFTFVFDCSLLKILSSDPSILNLYLSLHVNVHDLLQCKVLFISVMPLEIQWSRWEGWDHINRFNAAIYVCLSKARTYRSNVICTGIFYIQWFKVKGHCSFWWYLRIVDHHCFKLSFYNNIIFFMFQFLVSWHIMSTLPLWSWLWGITYRLYVDHHTVLIL